jgi:hypothetical protein
MKTKSLFLSVIIALMGSMTFISCDKDDNEHIKQNESQFVSLKTPYLICAGRNPGGVGFDFEYKGEKGGANNLDSLTVDDFTYDLKIYTLKGEKPNGSLGGAPLIKLFDSTVKAVNYSTVDASCKGITAFKNLNKSNILNYTLQTDAANFDVSSIPTGTTGKPLMQDLMKEYSKLVIGQKWKTTANNDITDDEPVWIIETPEGSLVKFIVIDFPAVAPTKTGYVSIEWDFVN